MKKNFSLRLALLAAFVSLAIVACKDDITPPKRPTVPTNPVPPVNKPVMQPDIPAPKSVEGKDYFPVYISFEEPTTEDASFNLDRFFDQNQNTYGFPFSYSFLETNRLFNRNDATMVLLDRLEFLQYKDRKLTLNVTVDTASGDTTPASFQDTKNYPTSFTEKNKRQYFRKIISYKDLFRQKVFVGYYLLSKLDPKTDKWLSFKVQVADPFYTKFFESGNPVHISAKTDNSDTLSLLSFHSSKYAVDIGPTVINANYFPLDYLAPKDVTAEGKGVAYTDRINLKGDWRNHYFVYNLTVPSSAVKDPTKDPLFNPEFIGRFDTVSWTYNAQLLMKDRFTAQYNMPKFLIVQGNQSYDSRAATVYGVPNYYVFSYPPVIVYSPEFPEDKKDPKASRLKAQEVFFQELYKAALGAAP